VKHISGLGSSCRTAVFLDRLPRTNTRPRQGEEMKSRFEIEKLVINSGLFKIGLNGEPEAVFQLNHKDYPFSIGPETLKNVKINYLFYDLRTILSKYHNPPVCSYSIDDEIQEIQTRIFKILVEYVPAIEAEAYAKHILDLRVKSRPDLPRLDVNLKSRLKNTGAFEKSKKDARNYLDLFLPLYQTFHKHLELERETNFYVVHFLLGTGLKKGQFCSVYESVRKYMSRKANLTDPKAPEFLFPKFPVGHFLPKNG
jgi:hypothetical protein